MPMPQPGQGARADVMVVSAVVGLIACLLVLALFKAQIPGEAVGVISMVAGIFGTCLRDAFQFEFGSSRGSRNKDALLAERSAPPEQPAPPTAGPAAP